MTGVPNWRNLNITGVVEVDSLIVDGDVDLQRLRVNGVMIDGRAMFVEETPTSSDFPGTPGQTAFDDDFIYVAVAPNRWKRALLADW